jgi:hypothetical protein
LPWSGGAAWAAIPPTSGATQIAPNRAALNSFFEISFESFITSPYSNFYCFLLDDHILPTVLSQQSLTKLQMME